MSTAAGARFYEASLDLAQAEAFLRCHGVASKDEPESEKAWYELSEEFLLFEAADLLELLLLAAYFWLLSAGTWLWIISGWLLDGRFDQWWFAMGCLLLVLASWLQLLAGGCSCWSLAAGCWLVASGCWAFWCLWLLVKGCCLLALGAAATGYWLLVASRWSGSCLLATYKRDCSGMPHVPDSSETPSEQEDDCSPVSSQKGDEDVEEEGEVTSLGEETLIGDQGCPSTRLRRPPDLFLADQNSVHS